MLGEILGCEKMDLLWFGCTGTENITRADGVKCQETDGDFYNRSTIQNTHEHRVTNLVDPEEHGLLHVNGPLQLFGGRQGGEVFKT